MTLTLVHRQNDLHNQLEDRGCTLSAYMFRVLSWRQQQLGKGGHEDKLWPGTADEIAAAGLDSLQDVVALKEYSEMTGPEK